jgi:histidine triad (HIT) family protein
MTVFQKIAAREIQAEIVHETERLIAFKDVNPQAPIHVLIVPKQVITRLGEVKPDDAPILGELLVATQTVASKLGVLESGYRVVINSGRDAGESVPHLHVHLLAGRPLQWPPG